MASSRQRERELARRRYERRRLREEQMRARRRRRNSMIGAVAGTMAVIVGIVFGALAIADAGPFAPGSKATVKPLATPSASPSPSAPAAPTTCAKIKPNPPAKGQPVVPDVAGKAPTALKIVDVKKGTGAVAKSGSTLSVLYIGISCSTGTVFDASFKHGNQAFPVTLGKGSVIPGWEQGLLGVRAGGVRELVIPPALGYGVQGSPPVIKGNEVLIFLITVKSVK